VHRNQALAYVLLRLTLGLNMSMHGLTRILAGPAQFAATLPPEFQKTFLPAASVYAFGLALPFVEAGLGLLLFLGLFTRYALIAGALWIMALTFGSTLRQDWSASGIQLTYALLYAILLAFLDRNRYALDSLLRSK
jgi:thiosulfate dehydrogenase [quinone] large subunit